MREDPYYPPQDSLWPAFNDFMVKNGIWKENWNFCEGKGIWWSYWLAFVAGVEAQKAKSREKTHT